MNFICLTIRIEKHAIEKTVVNVRGGIGIVY
jgi:hypothetical protein